VCDEVMDKMGYEKGLIRYTTEHNLSGEKTKLLRPRLVGYAAALLIMISLFSYTVFNRTLVELHAITDRIPYRENMSGRIENVYLLRIITKDQHAHTYVLEASGLSGITLEGKQNFEVQAGEIFSAPVSVSVDPENIGSSTNKIEFTIQSVDDQSISRSSKSTFTGPVIR